MTIDLSGKQWSLFFTNNKKNRGKSTSTKNLEMRQTILNCVEFSAFFFQTSFPICEYQI